MRARILAVGSAIPERRVTNRELEAELDLPAGWIRERTGIEERPLADPHQATSDLAVAAGQRALERAGFEPAAIGLVLLATSTPDYLLPPSAPNVAYRLGLARAGAIDMAGACAGFLYALGLGDSFVRTQKRPVMVIGANVLTRRVNPRDRDTRSLFADGAGAVILAPSLDERGILAWDLGADGADPEALYIPAGGSRTPFSAEALERGDHWLRLLRGERVFRRAVEEMSERGHGALASAGLTIADVDWWIPHQANRRILSAAARRLGLPPGKVFDCAAKLGNSSAATIPLALSLALEQGLLAPGQCVLFTAVGAGLLSAGLVARW